LYNTFPIYVCPIVRNAYNIPLYVYLIPFK
jgi:hypothetical protein